MSGTILLLIGESGSGKTTIAETLAGKFGLKVLRSYTTRPKRYENERGHIFVSEREFRNLKPKDIIAYTKIGEYEYCATKQQIDDSDIYVIDLKGMRYLKNNYKGGKKTKTVYLKVSQELRKQRMMGRGDREKDIIFRLKNDIITFNGAEELADFIIENDKTYEETSEKIWRYYIYGDM
ncbi:MAG: hypothetical protein HFE59_07685 [Clostridiales bacterium]|nr:hypothetical protein [Clostridiales bacterium]